MVITWLMMVNNNLVGGWATPLKKSQLGWLFPIYGKIKNVKNHKPIIIVTMIIPLMVNSPSSVVKCHWEWLTYQICWWIMTMVVKWVLLTSFMWVKQCHKPPMNGNHTTYLWWNWGMVYYCFTHTIPLIMVDEPNLVVKCGEYSDNG